MHTEFLLESLKGRDRFLDAGIDERIILESILGKQYRKWIRFKWLRIGSNGGLL
jgi:hypothetical protein